MVALLTTASLEGQHLAKSFFNTGLLGAAGASAPSDDEFNRVSFLSHFEGSNNGVNNAFDDGSASNHTITANGGVTQGSFGPFARPDGEWGVSFDGDSDYLQFAGSSDFAFGTGDFTFECFFFMKDAGTYDYLMTFGNNTNADSIGLYIQSGLVKVYNGAAIFDSGSTTVTFNTWHHVAVVRISSTLKMYLDGNQVHSVSNSSNIASTGGANIARWGLISDGQYFNGVISNARVVKGTGVYTGNFTPSTSKLTAITNTKLLTCQSNRFVDNSASAHTVTPYATSAVTSFGPFLSNAVYDPAVNGASAYFRGGGTDDYLITANASSDFNLGTGQFTFECWVYLTSSAQQTIIGSGISGSTFMFNIFLYQDVLQVHSPSAALLTNAGALQINAWQHIVVERDSNNDLKAFLNGTQTATTSTTADFGANDIFKVGTHFNGSNDLSGYVSDVRFIKGSGVAPQAGGPTAPLSTVTNTKLLLNMADGQAIDSAAQNNLTLYGTAKTSTAQKKFGTASLLLDGNSDYVSFADADVGSMFNFGATKWTIEGWFYQENDAGSGSNSHAIISRWDNQNSDKGFIFRITDSSGQKLQWLHTTDGSTNVVYTDSRTISSDTWYHFAFVKNDNLTLYLNGTGAVLNSSTFTIASTTIPTLIGTSHESGSPSQYFDGYIDDIRVTTGVARYTSNFTAPTKAFPDKGQ